MKALIITEKIDREDEIFGFFHGRLVDFVEKNPKTVVICLEKGEYSLPKQVEVFSLGKEKRRSRVGYILNFYKLIWNLRYSYDVVFVHMAPQYAVMGSFLWRLMGKKVVFWYQHTNVDWWLKLAIILTHRTIIPVLRKNFPKNSKILLSESSSDLESFVDVYEKM